MRALKWYHKFSLVHNRSIHLPENLLECLSEYVLDHLLSPLVRHQSLTGTLELIDPEYVNPEARLTDLSITQIDEKLDDALWGLYDHKPLGQTPGGYPPTTPFIAVAHCLYPYYIYQTMEEVNRMDELLTYYISKTVIAIEIPTPTVTVSSLRYEELRITW